MTNATMTDEVTHLFQQAGLGVAPFRFVGAHVKTYQACHGAPVQPGGSCAYCGTGIMECCVIRDANGKEFIVGNVCVGKTGDAGLINLTKRAINALRTANKHVRDDLRIQAARELLEVPAVRAALQAQPHPRGFGGQSMLDSVRWYLGHAGRKGMVQAARIIEAARA